MENLLNIQEIEITYKNPKPYNERHQITSPFAAAKICRQLIGDNVEYKELFFAVFLNHNNQVLGALKISEGGISNTIVDTRLIFQAALKAHACHLVITHNHPSGKLNPSKADENITKRIKNAGEILNIVLLDHIIITAESFYSFSENSLI